MLEARSFKFVAPEVRQDPIYYLLRVFGDGQLTTGGAPTHPITAHRDRRSATSGMDRGYGRILCIDRASGKVVFTKGYRRLQSFQAIIPQLQAHENEWDIFLGPQGWWQGGMRNGRRDQSWHFNTANMRWLNDIPVDLDLKYLNQRLRLLWANNRPKFLELLKRKLIRIGIRNFVVIETNPNYGLQLHALIRPIMANQGEGPRNSTMTFKSVSAALYKYLRCWGADPRASKRPTQVFRWPGFGRPSWPGFRVQMVMDVSDGPRASIYDLMEALSKRRLVERAIKLMPSIQRHVCKVRSLPWCKSSPWTHMAEMIDRGEIKGMRVGEGRRHMAFVLALALFAEAALHRPDEANEASVLRRVRVWNSLNIPELPDRVIVDQVAGAAATGHRHICKDVWKEVCVALGISIRHPYAYTPAKPRDRRERDHMEEVEADLLLFLAQVGREWKGTQLELVRAIQSVTGHEVHLRSVQRAQATLGARGALEIQSKRGRGGYIRLALLTADASDEVRASGTELSKGGQSVTGVDENPPTPQEAPKGDSCVPVLAMTGGGWVSRGQLCPKALLLRCRMIFGEQMVRVVEDEGPAGGQVLPGLGSARWRLGGRRELLAVQGVLCRSAGLVRRVRVCTRMKRVLDLAGEVGQLRYASWREEAAWLALGRGCLAAEELGWLLARVMDQESLVRLLELAEAREIERSSAKHAELLRIARLRLKCIGECEKARNGLE